MKTMITIGEFLEEPARFTEAKLPALAVRMLAEAFSKHRRPEAILLVDKGSDGQPVYLTVGSYPPELHTGDRSAFGVCSPIEMQDPVAVFGEREAAVAWGDAQPEPYRIVEIKTNDMTVPRVAVASLLVRDGKALLGKLALSGLWALPEGLLGFGETVDATVQRTLLSSVGLLPSSIALSRSVPFVNTYYADLQRHYVTLLALVEATGEPRVVDPAWSEWGWFDTATAPPSPLLPSVQQIMHIARLQAAPSIPVEEETKAKAVSLPSPSKPLRPRRSRSR